MNAKSEKWICGTMINLTTSLALLLSHYGTAACRMTDLLLAPVKQNPATSPKELLSNIKSQHLVRQPGRDGGAHGAGVVLDQRPRIVGILHPLL